MSRASELMIDIPGGTVDLRDDRKGTTWTAAVQPFRLARYPMTTEVLQGDSTSTANTPAVNVSWIDAVAACNKLSADDGVTPAYLDVDGDSPRWDRQANGYRLATEAEWQYACKAGTTGYRYGDIDDIAWYSDNSDGHVHPAGLKEPNAWGLHDMIGNVWEWCWDLYDPEVYGTYRIFRGGSWAEEARGCGASVRRRSHPTFAIDDLGFRIAQSVGTGE
ncbi:SUMF1/EgtB/PvdO family nonheme iron enzyme [Rhodococcus sp. IEGM 1379]|uniref:formylglycine-generating enzyme family protein n=1 Tax=Rhodococcus sp. IEGM 1379 TaxID=3047086 RepID=UPI0024B7709E|nr:SUMF1/EgtB/PvdO family nonheme iron enzyme [Rhodococcus sp. IEGM 1379]MDI9914055.1 SUMF1/EgtB/PvdO family nonheme iron enzyme [Rhodococcus sp. IEGM 1379]